MSFDTKIMAERLGSQILIRTHAPPDHEIGYLHYEHSKTCRKCIIIELWKLDEKKKSNSPPKSTDNINSNKKDALFIQLYVFHVYVFQQTEGCNYYQNMKRNWKTSTSSSQKPLSPGRHRHSLMLPSDTRYVKWVLRFALTWGASSRSRVLPY